MASTTSLGIPSILQKTLFEPPGRHVSGVEEPASPLAASFTVPSPPNATTTSKRSRTASVTSSIAWPLRSVSIAVTS